MLKLMAFEEKYGCFASPNPNHNNQVIARFTFPCLKFHSVFLDIYVPIYVWKFWNVLTAKINVSIYP